MKRIVVLAALSAVVSLLIAVAAGATGASGSQGFGDHARGYANRLVAGTWLWDVTNADGTKNETMGTFSPGGGLVTTGRIGGQVGLGSWEYLGRNRIADTYQVYAQQNGQFSVLLVVRAEAVIRGDTMSGRFEFDVINPAGERVFSDSGTFTGERYETQPLD